jgi:outer membrane protein assembly factor BamB
VTTDAVYAAGDDGTVYAVSTGDGTEHWQFETETRWASPPVVADGTVYIESSDGTVYALTEL